jgi:hypothetical protein
VDITIGSKYAIFDALTYPDNNGGMTCCGHSWITGTSALADNAEPPA